MAEEQISTQQTQEASTATAEDSTNSAGAALTFDEERKESCCFRYGSVVQ
jgi:hypothetical protein